MASESIHIYHIYINTTSKQFKYHKDSLPWGAKTQEEQEGEQDCLVASELLITIQCSDVSDR